MLFFFFFKHKTAYEMRISDWSSDVCSSDLFYDPEQDNADSLQEDAYEQMCEFHRLLTDMRDRTRLSVVAGMFHEWDKQLRDWLVREIQHWRHGETAAQIVCSAGFVTIADLCERLGWPISGAEFLRQVVAGIPVVKLSQ